jgi:hypothetical protein
MEQTRHPDGMISCLFDLPWCERNDVRESDCPGERRSGKDRRVLSEEREDDYEDDFIDAPSKMKAVGSFKADLTRREEREPVARIPSMTALALELAWGLIANAYGGDWDKASDEWREAATRWRDEHWHGFLNDARPPVATEPLVHCWNEPEGGGSTCLLLEGHDGPCEYTSDSEIRVRFDGISRMATQDTSHSYAQTHAGTIQLPSSRSCPPTQERTDE